MPTVSIPSLEGQRAKLLAETDEILNRSNVTEADLAEARAKGEQVDAIDAAIDRLGADERRSRLAGVLEDTPRGGAHVRGEPTTYSPGSNRSYFADLIRSTRDGDTEAQDRLRSHAGEVRVDAERRLARGATEYRDLSRVDGAGGQFVPPLFLVDAYVAMARAGRPTANVLDRRPLPGGTDSINIPAVTTGTATAIQTADNAAVQETDLVDSNLVAPVRTISGQQDVAVQLLEQSPIAFDEVVFSDLVADYNTKLNVQVLSGSGAAGQMTGLRTVAGINAVTYTDATPTVPEIYPKLADAIQQVSGGVFLPPTHIIMHPRRWAWFTAALDLQNRPLVVPGAGMNAAGAIANNGAAEGIVGTLQGLPVVVDPSIPTNLGAGVNEDIILVIRGAETMLWESTMRTRVLPDVGSATLTTRCQIYAFSAMVTRRPRSISTVSGTGLIGPVF